MALKSFIRGKNIEIHRDQFGIMFELPFFGISYTHEGRVQLKRFKLSMAIKSFVMNHMKDMKLHVKANYIKEKIMVAHYLITRILLPRKDNLEVIIRENVFPLWLLKR